MGVGLAEHVRNAHLVVEVFRQLVGQGYLGATSPLRCHHRAGVGAARCRRRAPATGDPARRLRGSADSRGRRPSGVDVDFMRGVVRPVQQRDGEPLKSETSRTPLPIPSELALELSAAVPGGVATTSSRTALGGSPRRGPSNGRCGQHGVTVQDRRYTPQRQPRSRGAGGLCSLGGCAVLAEQRPGRR